ncbi:zebrafish ch211-108c17.2-related family, partial [Trichomonas vaginalis G3]
MPRRTKAVAKRIKNLVQSAKNRVEPYVVNTVEFVLSVLLSGATFCQSEFQFMLNNIKVPSEATFHRVQEKVGRVIIEVARESVNYWKSRMRKCSGLLFDGSWSQRRNAMFCYVQFVEEKLKKIV